MSARLLLATALLALLACEPEEPFVPFGLPPELSDLDLSYIPFEYLRDGCMYRASYVGMELAVSGRPALAVQALDCDVKRSIHGPAGERWRQHVAPAFVANGEVRVVDPSFADRLLTPHEWLAGLGSDNLALTYRSAAFSSGAVPEGTCPVETGQEYIVGTVAEMIAFDSENIRIWCSYLRRYLRDAGQDPDGRREAALVARTTVLFDRLVELGLVSTWGEPVAAGTFQCPDALILP